MAATIEREEADSSPGRKRRLWWVFVLGLGAFSFFYLDKPITDWAANDPWDTGLLLGLTVGSAFGVYWLLPPRGNRWDKRAANTFWIAPVAVIAVASAVATYNGIQDRRDGILHDYCAYGSVSRAQFNGCLDHVRVSHIEDLDTNAARFGRNLLDACLSDAGPYCERALENRLNDQRQPNEP